MVLQAGEEARERVMNTLPSKAEEHSEVKECDRNGEQSLAIVLHNIKNSEDLRSKVSRIFEWVEKERGEYLVYNRNRYNIHISDNIYTKGYTRRVHIPVDITRKE